jgi:hypothetical protein
MITVFFGKGAALHGGDAGKLMEPGPRQGTK